MHIFALGVYQLRKVSQKLQLLCFQARDLSLRPHQALLELIL